MPKHTPNSVKSFNPIKSNIWEHVPLCPSPLTTAGAWNDLDLGEIMQMILAKSRNIDLAVYTPGDREPGSSLEHPKGSWEWNLEKARELLSCIRAFIIMPWFLLLDDTNPASFRSENQFLDFLYRRFLYRERNLGYQLLLQWELVERSLQGRLLSGLESGPF